MRHLKPADLFLEIGPGNLYLTEELLSYFKRGMALDYSPEIVNLFEKMPSEARNRIELIIGDFLEIDLPNRFDCIVACEVLEHVPDEANFLRRVRDSLAPGGQLLLSVPAHIRYWSIHDEVVGHLRRYEREGLTDLIEQSGFNKVRVISYGYPFVNFLRYFRVADARRLARERRGWDQVKQTQASGQAGMSSVLAKFLGLFFNPVTTYPLCLIASSFNSLDLSNGYIVVAEAAT